MIHSRNDSMKSKIFLLICLVLAYGSGEAEDALVSGWQSPPREAKLRNYWWWLNGCVTKEAISRDLEEMAAKGFGGALICDADGSGRGENLPVPHGPTFMTPEWRELFRHALREAERLDLEMSVNIQSGWNLGGPHVTTDDAGKKYVWTETSVQGPAQLERPLAVPDMRNDYYRDSVVVAYPIGRRALNQPDVTITASSNQLDGPGSPQVTDGDLETFWVSDGLNPGEGPTLDRPEWIEARFVDPLSANRITVKPRPRYGPKKCELLVSVDGTEFKSVKKFTVTNEESTTLTFDSVSGHVFRLMIYGAYDPRHPSDPRGVQIAELQLASDDKFLLGRETNTKMIKDWRLKAGIESLHKSAPDTTSLLIQDPSSPGEETTHTDEVIDLTSNLDEDGVLRWNVPPGQWNVIRLGYTVSNRARVSTSSEGWRGFAIDVLDEGAFQRYWTTVVEPMIADAKPFLGKTLKYLHTDSWEIEPLNWTPTLLKEFADRRGYDPIPWLPVLTGRIVNDRNSSNQFLHDFRKTIGDLVIDHHYRPFRELANENGLSIHPESGGPHAVPIDAQRCLGCSEVPMSEFWAESWRHRVGDENRFFVKQPASAAHTYGRRLVAAEGFTTMGPHWQETLWDNLKPAFDKACCEGMNLLFWHEFVCSPKEQGIPGIQYFAGTHLNPNVTWWEKSKPVFDYINRCQFMLQRGLFVADVCYYYGDHVPNFAQLKSSDPAGILPGFDYDVITEEALLTRATVSEGRIVLPDGMSYRLLVLRNHDAISLPVLQKVQELIAAGATVIGPRPKKSMSLAASDADIRAIAKDVWERPNVYSSISPRDYLSELGIRPDFEFDGKDAETNVDYIHRRDGTADIYFLSNRSPRDEEVSCTFRVVGKQPELWDPVSGQRQTVVNSSQQNDRTSLPVRLPPYGSLFVVFRNELDNETNAQRTLTLTMRQTLETQWEVTFDPRWGGPGTVKLNELISWPEHPNEGIKFYSGTAVYRTAFTLSDELTKRSLNSKFWLDLGKVRELAEVRVNGHQCGIVWTPPFRVDISDHIEPGENRLEIDVVNFWPNRIIGDASLPVSERFTRTNIRSLTADTKLMESGLLGPVTIMSEDSENQGDNGRRASSQSIE